MIVSFTGTRHGMTAVQLLSLADTLLEVGATELHHGDCVGADAEADAVAQRLEIPRVVHPPLGGRYRAWIREGPTCTVLAPAPYLTRNLAIVDAGQMLIAAPQTREEEQRSGTWATVRYGRRLGRMVVILAPSLEPNTERNLGGIGLPRQSN
jgi:hypothetical protein